MFAQGRVATVSDLHEVEGQAELISGRIVQFPLHGHRVGQIVGAIAYSLGGHSKTTGLGDAFGSTLGYVVPKMASGRESFCPDASYYVGPPPTDPMDFVPGPPTFAVEIRGVDEAGLAFDSDRATKRLDYFEAGTLVVWDVDPEAECVHSYRANSPDQPVTFVKGQEADAEPAVPGWRIAVDDLFA